ncbi:MAG TPA: hypothetical protein VFX21_07870, partial [Acidimicrobiia bacterium]|nr:hypothetical protein [Acidimicrobiia bacterium]
VAALAVVGAIGGVLVWNRPPARIYLGDAGSYLIGTALALLLGGALAPGQPVATGAAALLLVGVPVIDTSVAIVRRFRAHRPLLQGDRGHVYDQLVDRGWRPIAATGACVGAQAVLAAAAIAIAELPAGAAVVTVAIVIALVGGVVLTAFTTPGSWARDLE